MLSPQSRPLVHKLAVLGKDYYTIGTIGDLFVFAGADRTWVGEPDDSQASQRMAAFYGWINGISAAAPHELHRVIKGVADQVADNTDVPEGDRAFLRRQLESLGTERPGKELGSSVAPPDDLADLLEILIKGTPRAMRPLRRRRKGYTPIPFDSEYDLQDLLRALLGPWVGDIRREEYTPSHAGSSSRIDLVLPKHQTVIEAKYVRDARHAKKIGDELLLDVAHYRVHPNCDFLWAVILDSRGEIENAEGLVADLEGEHANEHGNVSVRVRVLTL